MPGLTHRIVHSNSSTSSTSYISTASGSVKDAGVQLHSSRCGIDSFQLQKFWNELSLTSRRELLRVDKHTLFEQVRKNLYCSRCNGLLLEGFSQIILHGKNIQGGSLHYGRHITGDSRDVCDKIDNVTANDVRDPSVHPWGGLTATRDSMLTLLECFYDGQPLEVLQNVFDCARARERERGLLYPDACGGGGRGWISQGNCSTGFGRGYSLKETCALHTARLSCDALVDFWSALGEETRRSLLRMKEEDFIARLLFRFDSKRFCRDCRRNVLREFKELKELKRTRKEPRCTRWFCTADTAFRYEVTNTSVQVNWRECFEGDVGVMYQHFEWALGSAEGTSDILGFEDVGFSEGARVDGLDLSHVPAFYITLRAWKHDGRYIEISVKAHALNGQQCVHRRLIVGDGYVSITKGESIQHFFEHAEEAEEEEDDEGMEKDGGDPESEGSRFQKHAKSPELAREFLLDAATVIFKEQVEKAFREGTARQNAHMIFVCLALGLLEERILVACKEISTLEKQNKLLEEEEHEKREEEQRRERKRLKEKEKKMRRKEKLKGRERDKEKDIGESRLPGNPSFDCDSGACGIPPEEDVCVANGVHTAKAACLMEDRVMDSSACPSSLDTMQAEVSFTTINDDSKLLLQFDMCSAMDGTEDPICAQDSDSIFVSDQSKAARRRLKIRKGPFMETISGHMMRRRAGTGLESRNGIKSCELGREKVEKASSKHCKPSNNHDRNAQASWLEHWGPRHYQKLNQELCTSQSSKSMLCPSRKWKDTVVIKGRERKAAFIIGQQVYGVGKPIFNWKAIKSRVSASCDGTMIQEQHAKSDVPSTSFISEQSSLVEMVSMCPESGKVTLSGLKRDHSRTLTNNPDGLAPNEHEVISEDSVAEELSGETEDSVCAVESLESSGSPPVELETFSPLHRLGPLCSDEATNDDDLSPSSEASCVTDASDGLTSDSMTTENSCMEVIYASQNTLAVSSYVSSEPSDFHHNVEGIVPNSDLLSADDYYGYAASGTFSPTEFYPYSAPPSMLAPTHGLPCSYMQSPIDGNLECSFMNVEQQLCQLDSSVQLPVISAPVLPHFPAEHYGYPWIQGHCDPVINPELLPFPHPGGLLLNSSAVSYPAPNNGELPNGFISLSPQYQPVQPVMSFTCLPSLSAEPTCTHWRGSQHPVFKDQDEMDTPVLADASNQFSSCYQGNGVYAKESLPTPTPTIASDSQVTDLPLRDGFSLFHFGGLPLCEDGKESSTGTLPSEGISRDKIRHSTLPCRAKLQEGVPKFDIPVEEYTLFAATPAKRFSFF